MTGPGDIGYGPALDAIRKRLDNIERAVMALARVIEARYNSDILRRGDEVIVHELAGVMGYINHDEVLAEIGFTWPKAEQHENSR